MVIESIIEKYGIYVLIFIYIFINLYYKNTINIVIFFIALLATINLLDVKIYSVVLAYIISIIYGIFNNYHLLENFKLKIKEHQPSPIINEKIDILKEFKEIMNERLCNNYIDHIQSKYTNIVKDGRETCDNLKPILTELDTKLVSKFVKDETIDKRIVISSDKFIILGHYWWYALKILINQNKIGEEIDVIVIDMPLKKLMYSIHEFNTLNESSPII